MPLGEHLRSNKYVYLTGVHAIANRGERAESSGAVTVDACNARTREVFGKGALEPLRAVPEGQEVDVAALGTGARQALRVTAMVAP